MTTTLKPTNLVRAFDVGRRLNYSTATVKRYAKMGIIPGAVFVGRHVRFDPEMIEEFISSGGLRTEPQPAFGIRKYGHRGHAGTAPANQIISRTN